MRILLFIYTLLGCISLSYTKVNDTLPITINFDENGKIIGTLPNYIKPNSAIKLNYTEKENFDINKMEEYKNLKDINSLFSYKTPLNQKDTIYLDISPRRFLFSKYINDTLTIDSLFKAYSEKLKSDTSSEINSFNFKLIKNGFENQILEKYYTKTYNDNYKPLASWISNSDIAKLEKEMQGIYQKIANAQKFEGNIIRETLLDSILNYSKNNSYLLNELNQYIQSNFKWIYYTSIFHKSPTLNPLIFTDTVSIRSKITELQTELDLLKSKLSILDSLYKKCTLGECGKTSDIFSTYSKEREPLQKKIIELSSDISKQNNLLVDNEKIKSALSISKSVIYEGKLYPSTKKQTIIMRHHNAAENMNSMDTNTINFDNKRYYEDEEIKIIVNNAEPSKQKITFDTIITKIEEDEFIFTEYAKKYLTDFQGKYGVFFKAISETLSNKDLSNNNSFKLILKNGGELSNQKEIDKQLKVYNDNIEKKLNENIKNINNFIQDYAMIKWLSQQTEPQPYPKFTTAPAKYKTQIFEPKMLGKIPGKVDYKVGAITVSTKDTLKAPNLYKVYKKQYVQFTAMTAFFASRTNRDVLDYNTSTNTFTTINYKPFDIVLGIKVYPFGINARRWFPKSGTKNNTNKLLIKRGDHAVNRISFIAGLSVSQKQLRNYFLGTGYEIVPGLGVNLGVNFYSTPSYNIQANRLISKKEIFKPALFWGISVDPVVLIKAITITKF